MEEVGVRDIEGLAMVGAVSKSRVVREGRSAWRLCVETVDGRELCTPPLQREELELVKRCVDHYSRIKLVR